MIVRSRRKASSAGVHHELLRQNKVEKAIGIDASAAGLKAVARNADRLNLSEKVQYFKQDFAQNAQMHTSADLVVLDRVICCYPYLDLLLGQAAEKASRYLAISFPVENFLVKLGVKTADFFLTLFGSGYHPYLYGHDEIRQTAEGAGLTLAHTNRHVAWQIMVFERHSQTGL